MEIKAQKWGNSVGVRLPKALGVKPGTALIVRKGKKGITLTPKPSKSREEMTLEELVALITPENRHESVWENVRPVGKEIW